MSLGEFVDSFFYFQMKSEILEGFLKVKTIFDTEKKQYGCRGEG